MRHMILDMFADVLATLVVTTNSCVSRSGVGVIKRPSTRQSCRPAGPCRYDVPVS